MKGSIEMNVLEGKLVAEGMKIGIVCARFNEFITSKLLGGAMDDFHDYLSMTTITSNTTKAATIYVRQQPPKLWNTSKL